MAQRSLTPWLPHPIGREEPYVLHSKSLTVQLLVTMPFTLWQLSRRWTKWLICRLFSNFVKTVLPGHKAMTVMVSGGAK